MVYLKNYYIPKLLRDTGRQQPSNKWVGPPFEQHLCCPQGALGMRLINL